MTSRDIAELTGKQHAHVMRDIRTMLETLEKDVSSFGSIFQDAYGRDQQEFRLPKDLTLTLVTGYDVKRRHAINVRWLELEEKARNPIVALPRVDLLKMALDSEEKRLALEHKVDELAHRQRAEAGRRNRRQAHRHETGFALWKRVHRVLLAVTGFVVALKT